MNKVFNCADDLNIKIYYQDTDSTHMNYDDVPRLCEYYKQTYTQELVGNGLGNFYIDFDLPGSVSDIYSKESLFVSKNTYIDVLESTDKDNKIINANHIRMKGIPTPCSKYYATQNNISVLGVYKQLYDNKSIKFDLTNDGNKCVCRNDKDYTVSNVSDFTRKCQYIRDERDTIFIK